MFLFRKVWPVWAAACLGASAWLTAPGCRRSAPAEGLEPPSIGLSLPADALPEPARDTLLPAIRRGFRVHDLDADAWWIEDNALRLRLISAYDDQGELRLSWPAGRDEVGAGDVEMTCRIGGFADADARGEALLATIRERQRALEERGWAPIER